jgi:hypothetical protein
MATNPANHAELSDWRGNLKALIEAKREGKTIVEEAPPKRAPVIDMMEALKRSLHQTEMQREKNLCEHARELASEKGATRQRLAHDKVSIFMNTQLGRKGGQVPVFGVRRQAPVRQRGSVSP